MDDHLLFAFASRNASLFYYDVKNYMSSNASFGKVSTPHLLTPNVFEVGVALHAKVQEPKDNY